MTRNPLQPLVRSCLVVVALTFAHPAVAAEAVPPDKHLEQGLTALERGAFEDAVSSLSEAARLYERASKPTAQAAALMPLARAYSAIGQYRQAIKTLEAALELTEKSGEKARIAAVLAGLGNSHIAIGSLPAAEGYLQNSLSLARALGDSALAASILNDLGNVSAINKKYPEAIAAYRESIVLAKRVGHRLLTARALTNSAAALRQNGAPQEAETSLDAAFDHFRLLSPSHDTAFGLTSVGLAYRDLRPALQNASGRLSLRAAEALNQAATVA